MPTAVEYASRVSPKSADPSNRLRRLEGPASGGSPPEPSGCRQLRPQPRRGRDRLLRLHARGSRGRYRSRSAPAPRCPLGIGRILLDGRTRDGRRGDDSAVGFKPVTVVNPDAARRCASVSRPARRHDVGHSAASRGAPPGAPAGLADRRATLMPWRAPCQALPRGPRSRVPGVPVDRLVRAIASFAVFSRPARTAARIPARRGHRGRADHRRR